MYIFQVMLYVYGSSKYTTLFMPSILFPSLFKFSWYQSSILDPRLWSKLTMDDSGKKRFITEPHSPYYLHPSKGPSVMITIIVFDGQNNDLWESVVRTTLKANNKLGFVDGILERPKEWGVYIMPCMGHGSLDVMLFAAQHHRPAAVDELGDGKNSVGWFKEKIWNAKNSQNSLIKSQYCKL